MGDREAMVNRLLQSRKFSVFFLKEAIDVALHILFGRSFQILGASKPKLWPKCLTDLHSQDWKGGTVRY